MRPSTEQDFRILKQARPHSYSAKPLPRSYTRSHPLRRADRFRKRCSGFVTAISSSAQQNQMNMPSVIRIRKSYLEFDLGH